MADTPIVVTAASVKESTGAQTEVGVAGATITAGQLVYKWSANNRFYLTDVDATSVSANAEVDNLYGVALNSASAGQPLEVIKSGDYYHGGAGVTAGRVYAASAATAGSFCLASGLVATDRLSILGYSKSATIMHLCINVSDVAVA